MGVDAFTVYQEILSTDSGVRINNIVSFGPTIGQLKVWRPISGADIHKLWRCTLYLWVLVIPRMVVG